MFDHCGQGLPATVVGRAGDDLELVDALAALAMDGAEAVGAGVAAADDDHVLAFGRDELASGIESPATRRFCSGGTPWRGGCRSRSRPSIGRSRAGRAAAEADGVEPGEEFSAVSRRRRSCRAEDDPFGLHLLEPAVEERFSILKSGMP